jgi:hypothetical protein
MPIKDMASFETEALTLPATKRAILAKHLLASLDDLNEQENEQMWLDEADRRYQAYKDGGRIRQVDRQAAKAVERFDPEGGKSPGGEWRSQARQAEPSGGSATGLRQ